MTISTKRVIDMTEQEYKACRRLCFRSDGFMFWDIAKAMEKEQSYHPRRRFSRVYMITDGDLEDGAKLLAWALITPRKSKGYNAQFYTRASLRNKGLGSKLMAAVQTIDRHPYVIPHDNRSGGFFKKSKQFVKIDDRGYPEYME